MAFSDLSNRVEAALRAVLPESVDINLSASGSQAHDFNVTIRGKSFRVEWVSRAWLSAIEGILAQPDRPDIVVGERVSPASRKALNESGIGWVETSGAAQIDTDFLVVSRSGEPGRAGEARGEWTPAVLGVAEAVLAGVKPTVSATHAATGLSVGACTKALRVLCDLGHLEAEARRGPQSGRQVSDRDSFLDAYVAAAHDIEPSLPLAVGVIWRDPVEGLIDIGARWDDAGVPWVTTGLVAAAIVAPHVTSVGTAEVYVVAADVPELDLAASVVGLRPIAGGRLILSPLPTKTTLQMAKMVDGLRIAPWPRLVADLRRSGVRGEGAAEQVKETLSGG
ncbi:MAG: hypothetical protein ACRDWA_10795 [Acidimicrobiia bacterium]